MNILDLISNLGKWSAVHPEYLWWTLGAAGGIVALSSLVSRRRKNLTTHGSARWATRREVRRAGLYAQQGIVLGRDGDLLRHNGPEHVLLIGPTRSGKGVGIIVPTLLDWQESVIVLDPKDGENYDITAAWRKGMSNVYAFTPCRSPHTRINVLDVIRQGTPHEVGDAQLIAQSLTAPGKLQGENSTSVHFRELATLLLTAAILHVAHVGKRKSLPGVWEFLTQQQTSLAAVLRVMGTTSYASAEVGLAITSMTTALRNIAGDRELSSVWSTAIRPLVLYNDPLVAQSTDMSDFDIEALQYGPKPVSLYLIAPSPMALERLHPAYRVILDVVAERLMEHKVRTWNYRLLYVLDELPWHGYSRSIDKGIAVMGGYGMKSLVVTQDLSALLEVYGDHTAIFGNCQVKVIHAPDNDLTAKRISETILGAGTIESTSNSASYGERPNQSRTTAPIRRPLMTPDEVMELPATQEIIRISGHKPILAQKIDYRQEREWNFRWATL